MATHNINITLDGTLITGQSTVTPVSGDFLLLSDTSDSGNLKKVNASDFLGGGSDMVAYSYFNTSGETLADSQDYFLGQAGTLGGTVNAAAHVPIQGGTLRAVYLQTYNGSTFGSSEGVTATLYTNGGADSYEITTGLLYNARHTNLAVTGLSQVISTGASYITLDTPVFTTNPISAQTRITLIVEL